MTTPFDPTSHLNEWVSIFVSGKTINLNYGIPMIRNRTIKKASHRHPAHSRLLVPE